MKIKKNNFDSTNHYNLSRNLFSQKTQEKKELGVHPDTTISVFKARNVNEGMTISGVYISSVISSPCSEFIVIKKDTFYKNIPSQDTIFAPGQKIRINNKDRKVESLINNISIYKTVLPETNAIHFLSTKKDYIYINNIQTICNNDTIIDEHKNTDDLIL